MASITSRNPDDEVKRRPRIRAAEHGRSMEEEAREIPRQVVGQESPPTPSRPRSGRRSRPLAGWSWICRRANHDTPRPVVIRLIEICPGQRRHQ